MAGNEYVKLYIYEEVGEKILVDVYEADDFSDFLLVKVPGTTSEESFQQIGEAFKEVGRVVIGVREDENLSFYGVKVANDDS